MSFHVQSHKQLVDGVVDLAKRVQADKQLSALIRRKFAIKCTTGYSLNALVDFPVSDPIEIIKRLMIGSEGTLGFVSRATYNTVPEWPHKVRLRIPNAVRVNALAEQICCCCALYCVAHVGMSAKLTWRIYILRQRAVPRQGAELRYASKCG